MAKLNLNNNWDILAEEDWRADLIDLAGDEWDEERKWLGEDFDEDWDDEDW